MNFILYVKCTEQQDFSYSNPFYETLKSRFPSSGFLDLDNFSENELIEQACKALELSDKACVLFILEANADTKKFIKLATLLADRPEKYIVLITGKDERISKLLFPQEGFSIHNFTEPEQIKILDLFFL